MGNSPNVGDRVFTEGYVSEMVPFRSGQSPGSEKLGDLHVVSSGRDQSVPAPGQQTVFAACINMITIVLGAAIVAVPRFGRIVGLIPSLGLCCLAIAVVWRTGGKMTDAIVLWNAKNPKDKMYNFEDLGFRSFGRTGYLLVQVSSVLVFFGLGAVYMIIEVRQVQSLMMMVHPPAADWEYRYVLLAITPLLAGTCMFENLTALARVTPIAALCALMCIYCIVSTALRHWGVIDKWQEMGQDTSSIRSLWPSLEDQVPKSLGICMASYFGSFGINATFPSVMQEMHTPSDFKKVLTIVLSVVLILYSFIIVCTWVAFGNFNQDNVLVNMGRMPANTIEAHQEPDSWGTKLSVPVLVVFNICMVFNILVSHPLLQLVIFKSLRAILPSGLMLPKTATNYLIRLCVVFLEMGLAMTSEKVGPVFGLVGALCLPFHAVYIPIFCSDQIFKHVRKRESFAAFFVDMMIAVLGMLVLFFGTWASIEELSNSIA